MSLIAGTRLGPYEILSALGAGGMGEVYRATDTNLKRQVAIKVLPEYLAQDPERLVRFQREAEVLAALNHPNIAHIHGLEKADGILALVMELVEGPTLADRIARGPIPIAEALPIARQIAEALEAAHERGIIHRDLKPANIKVREDGTVKVLDFGLAKAMEPVAALSPGLSMSPTITTPAMTQAGMILGTAAYMSPEQASGKPVDKRSDIWSFGVVLWEMLSGRRLFDGETISHTLADVLRGPIDFSQLPDATPKTIRDLLRRCLNRVVGKRLRDIGEARIQLAEELSGAAEDPARPADASIVAPAPSRTRERVAWSMAVMLAGVITALGARSLRTVPTAAREVRFTVAVPQNVTLSLATNQSTPVVSPDGRRIVFVASRTGGATSLWTRSLDSLDAQPLTGTESPSTPFWSADSRTIGFFSGGKLKTIDAAGGPVQSLCDAPQGRSGAWNRDGTIVFGSLTGGLSRVAAGGGQPTPVTTPDASHGERAHRFPAFLPDGRHFLYFATPSNTIVIGSLDGKETTRLFAADSQAVYAPPGYLFFLRQGRLMTQGFDTRSLRPAGDALPVAEQVVSDNNGNGAFSVSDDGSLVYLSGSAMIQPTQLTWFDRAGRPSGSIGQPSLSRNPLLSPDGTRIAFEVVDPRGKNSDIWLLDVASGVPSHFTFDAHNDIYPVWSPDGSRIVFGSDREGGFSMYEKAANSAAPETLLRKSTSDDVRNAPTSWSGDFILFRDVRPNGFYNIGILALSGQKASFFQPSDFDQAQGQLSRNARWVAYESNESGRYEIYVQTFPELGGKWQISKDGGVNARWSANGRELFYYALDGELVAVPVTTGGATFEWGTAVSLFKAQMLLGPAPAVGFRAQYDVTRDGQRFLLNVPAGDWVATSLTVVLNWPALLKK